MEITQQHVGERLRASRVRAGLNQAEVAELAGISRKQVAFLEAGRGRVLALPAVRLAQALGLEVWIELRPKGTGPVRAEDVAP